MKNSSLFIYTINENLLCFILYERRDLLLWDSIASWAAKKLALRFRISFSDGKSTDESAWWEFF